MTVVLGIVACLGIIGVAVLGYVIALYNGLVGKKTLVDEAWSDIDTFLKKRYDMIPNLVEVVKGYAKHEKETLENVVKFRNMAMNASTPNEQIKAENQLTNALKTVFALAENYPDLKANQSFLDLQNKLAKLEEDIQKSRRFYNGAVKEYNVAIALFPANLIVPMLGFTKREFFKASEEERENVKVKF